MKISLLFSVEVYRVIGCKRGESTVEVKSDLILKKMYTSSWGDFVY